VGIPQEWTHQSDPPESVILLFKKLIESEAHKVGGWKSKYSQNFRKSYTRMVQKIGVNPFFREEKSKQKSGKKKGTVNSSHAWTPTKTVRFCCFIRSWISTKIGEGNEGASAELGGKHHGGPES